MKTLTGVNKIALATGIQQILLDMARRGEIPAYPIENFEHNVMKRKKLSRGSAQIVTGLILSTGIISRSGNDFTL